MVREPIFNPYGAPVYYAPVLTSTMEVARDLASAGCAAGTVVRAGYQTSGRGRRPHRSWSSEAGRNLLCTIAYRRNEDLGPIAGLPVKVGFSVCSAIEDFAGLDCTIKWPNDVLVRGRKLCGVLCEAAHTNVFVGIGVNVNQETFVTGLRRRPTSIALETGRPADVRKLLESILQYLYADHASDAWHVAAEKKLYAFGRPARANGVVGSIAGLDTDGALLLETESGKILRIVSGEISIDDRIGASG